MVDSNSNLLHLRLNLLLKIIEDFEKGKKNYKEVPTQIKSIIEMLEGINVLSMEKMENAWGYIKLISEEAMAEDMRELDGLWRKDFIKGLEVIREAAKDYLKDVEKVQT